MEEEILKIYDNLYNVIGVAPRSEVHKKGLLHQVVHLWMMEVKNEEIKNFASSLEAGSVYSQRTKAVLS